MLACGIDIDVVARHASTADNLAIRCRLDHLARDLGGRANDKGIIGPDALEQLVRGQAEALIDFVALPFRNAGMPSSTILSVTRIFIAIRLSPRSRPHCAVRISL